MMRWKNIIIIALLILVLVSGIFLLRSVNLISRIKGDMISRIEHLLNVDIEVKDLLVWPLNQLILKNIEINNVNYHISVPEIRIYYDFLKIIKNPINWFDSFSYIKIDTPIVDFKDFGSELTKVNEDSFLRRIKLLKFHGLKIFINDGKFLLSKGEERLELDKLSSSIDLSTSDYELALKTNLIINSYNWNNNFLNNINIEELKMAISLNDNGWSGDLSTEGLDLEFIETFISNLNITEKLGIKINDIKGKGNLILSFKGKDFSLDEYNAVFSVEEGKGLINADENILKGEFSNLTGRFIYYSTLQKLLLKDINFNFSENPFSLNGSLNISNNNYPELFLRINSPNMNLSSIGINKELIDYSLSGVAQFDLTITGNIASPDINMDIYLPQGEYKNQIISHLRSHLRYKNGLAYIDYFDLHLNQDNQLFLQGVYNILNKKYSLNFQGTGIETRLIRSLYNDFPKEIDGRINSSLIISGEGVNLDKINISGDVEILAREKFDNIYFDMWLADNKLILNNGVADLGKGEVNFSGFANLLNENLDIELNAHDLELSLLNKFSISGFEHYTGLANLNAHITESYKDPKIILDISMEKAYFLEKEINNVKSRLIYNDKLLKITNLYAKSGGNIIYGNGFIEMSELYPFISANLKIEGYEYNLISDYTGINIPLNGQFLADINIEGELDTPDISGVIHSEDSTLHFSERDYELDKLDLSFSWTNDEEIKINEFSIFKGKARLMLDGMILRDKLDLKFKLDNLEFMDLNLYKSVSGKLDMDGLISGDLDNPEIKGIVSTMNLKYQERFLDGFDARFLYVDKNLNIDRMEWSIANSQYYISGMVLDLITNPRLDFSISSVDGRIIDLMNIVAYNPPVEIDYHFTGEMGIKGEIMKPDILVNLRAFTVDGLNSQIFLKGEIAEEINMEIEGENVDISPLIIFIKDKSRVKGIDMAGIADFHGKVLGSINNINLELENKITEIKLRDIIVDSSEGELVISDGLLFLDQVLMMKDKRILNIKGDIPLNKKNLLDLYLSFNNLPVSIVSSMFSLSPELHGFVDGGVSLFSSLDRPEFSGKVSIFDADINLGLPEGISCLKGDIIFNGDKIEVYNLTGKYGDGNIILEGEYHPYNSKNNWQLKLKGNNLNFTHGSLKGRFDPDVIISGSLYSPLIKGDLITHDFYISLPFNWSVENFLYKPEFILTIYPGKDVYLNNKNIDILIQEGSLNLKYLDSNLEMSGILSSHQGSLDYYNNKFILNKGEAVFQKHSEFIPDIHVKANTIVNGTRVMVQANGPANNMITTFSSQPYLSQDEILSLLTSKGGIRELLLGNWSGVIEKELLRILNSNFQEGLVSDVESSLENIFHLNRLDIDTYNLGWEQEVYFYLGKYMSDKFYLQYSGTISPDERENEVSFNYFLRDNTLIEGSWKDNNDFRLSIEALLQF
jgi:translocation and assembly module TamB